MPTVKNRTKKGKTTSVYIPELKMTVQVKPGSTVEETRRKYLSAREFENKRHVYFIENENID